MRRKARHPLELPNDHMAALTAESRRGAMWAFVAIVVSMAVSAFLLAYLSGGY